MEFSKFGSERISYLPFDEVHGKIERLIVRIWTQAQLRPNEEIKYHNFCGWAVYMTKQLINISCKRMIIGRKPIRQPKIY